MTFFECWKIPWLWGKLIIKITKVVELAPRQDRTWKTQPKHLETTAKWIRTWVIFFFCVASLGFPRIVRHLQCWLFILLWGRVQMESHTMRVGRVAQEICLGAIAGHLFVFFVCKLPAVQKQTLSGWWLSLPLWKIWLRQYDGKVIRHVPNHQPVMNHRNWTWLTCDTLQRQTCLV